MTDMYFWIPNTTEDEPPADAKEDAFKLCNEINQNEILKNEGSAEDNDDGWGRHTSPEQKEFNSIIRSFHKDWLPVLAWSHGMSRGSVYGPGNLQDMSITKYTGPETPRLKAAVLRGDVFPVIVFRFISRKAKDKSLSITEFRLFKAALYSLSSGGSGGERKFTENLTIMFERYLHHSLDFSIETGDVIQNNHFYWNDATQIGITNAANSVPSLVTLCMKVIHKYNEYIPTENLLALPPNLKRMLERENLLPKSGPKLIKNSNLAVTYLVHLETDEEPSKKIMTYKEVVVPKQNIASLRAAVCKKFNRSPEDLIAIYHRHAFQENTYVEIEEDSQVLQLQVEARLHVSFKK